MAANRWMLTAWMLLPLMGCASLTDYRYEQTQRSRARSAWRNHGSSCEPNCYGKDYERGWKDGFYDVATGGKGCPPVVAPVSYWKPSQILEDCDRARNTYYSGFQDGVACALRYPQTHYLKLWTSCECPGPMCEKQCCPTNSCPTNSCPTNGCLQGGCMPSPHLPGMSMEGMMDESGSFENNVAIPVMPTSELPVPAAPEPQAEPEKIEPEALPEPKANAAQVRSSTWSGVEPAQPYDFDGAKANQDVVNDDLGFNEGFDQMIEDSSSEILRCTSKEPVK